MKKIIPAIIPKSLDDLCAQISLVKSATNSFQVDIVDGKFVPFTSWPALDGGMPSDMNKVIGDFDIELDLMIQRPEYTISMWLETNASRFVIHVESSDDIRICIDKVKEAGKKVALSLNNDTDISEIEEHINRIDYVQCMGIAEIGRQGNSFDERVLDRVSSLKKKHPELEVSVDGSVNFETIQRLRDAGVDRFVSGSAIFGNDNPAEAFSELTEIVS